MACNHGNTTDHTHTVKMLAYLLSSCLATDDGHFGFTGNILEPSVDVGVSRLVLYTCKMGKGSLLLKPLLTIPLMALNTARSAKVIS